ncbi:MAG: NB-ARC domain-containing protein, partial [Bacteroidota bacterium]
MQIRITTKPRAIIQQASQGDPQPGRNITKFLGDKPISPNVFIGREGELESIHGKLFSGENVLMLINGEGGIGKTTLAARYYHTYKKDYQHLCWLFTGNSLQTALLRLAIPLGISFDPKMPETERIPILFEALRKLPETCLFILDNANESAELEAHYQALMRLPNFHVLITSRLNKLRELTVYKVKTLSREKANTLFIKYYPFLREGEEEKLRAIFTAVGYNTLVIELLAKNLAQLNTLESTYWLEQLLEDLQGRNLLHLSSSEAVDTAYVLERQTPEEIIAGMYELLGLSPSKKRLLAIFSVLPAENIPYTRLKAMLPSIEEEKKDLMALAEEGWLDFDQVGRSFKVSPVVQEVVCKKHEGIGEDCEVLISGLKNLLTFEAGTGHFTEVSYTEAAIYTLYGETLLQSLQKNTYKLAALCINLGVYHSS